MINELTNVTLQVRSRVFNLKDKKNVGLREGLLLVLKLVLQKQINFLHQKSDVFLFREV